MLAEESMGMPKATLNWLKTLAAVGLIIAGASPPALFPILADTDAKPGFDLSFVMERLDGKGVPQFLAHDMVI